MFKKVLTVLPLCIVFLAYAAVPAQNKKTSPATQTQASRFVEPSSIAGLQQATFDKYSGLVAESPVNRKKSFKKNAQSDPSPSLREEMRNSFIISGGYLYQRVDDLPVRKVQGVSVNAFYYPVSWVGFGGEYQYGRGTETTTQGGTTTRVDKLTRHVAVFGPEFSGYAGESVRLFVHPLFGFAKEQMRISNLAGVGIAESTNLAFDLGAGLDVRLSRHLLLRPVQFDYTGIRRSNSWQNNWRLSTGFGVRP